MSRDHPNYNTIEISQNTEKSPGDMRLACHFRERQSANADVKSSQQEQEKDSKYRYLSSLISPVIRPLSDRLKDDLADYYLIATQLRGSKYQIWNGRRERVREKGREINERGMKEAVKNFKT